MTIPAIKRLRRLRASPTMRAMVRETRLSPDDLICPLFVTARSESLEPIHSMPGVHRFSVDRVIDEAADIAALSIPAVLVFGLPATKDAVASEASAPDGAVQLAVSVIKEQLPDLVVITDVCLCSYTDHGHCGLANGSAPHLVRPNYPDGWVLNDETLEVIAQVAVSHAHAGADMVAPSGMIDGMVDATRVALDEADFEQVGILSYAVKYASAFYGPFREAADGAPKHGDRKSHQMDPANAREALREVEVDVSEGADVVMVKPALPYLDVIQLVRREFPEIPLAAYNVSGEYSMVKAAAANGWISEEAVVRELLTGIKRAGADLIITYHAKDAARWLGVQP